MSLYGESEAMSNEDLVNLNRQPLLLAGFILMCFKRDVLGRKAGAAYSQLILNKANTAKPKA